ncbi:frequency clock protein [Fusarium solani]|uniref:Frequency clock protein n=1 Tax=Fusarium solani TaxID=169388 RepID=A0A9P9GFB5_FUSSL|nr:frequency clock protein [Fusarium solani]KAH7237906.1 frequency clock protein [Fusarium solani]
MPRSEPAPAQPRIEVSPRRSSSGDSHETGQSDPKKWFDHSNQNPTATINNNIIDTDPPFFQKESDSSDSEKPYFHNQYQRTSPKLTATHSSSADDYCSVINDLTVEIQKLREKLKRYKQTGPDMVRKDKLFEIKVHGLPKEKKRELEATLRDFAASLDGPPGASSSQRKKKPSRHNDDHIYSGSGIQLKHASSSSSNLRPADSAYASITTGAKSSTTSLSRPPIRSTESSKQKVENYLQDIPDGLDSRYVIMIDKELKNVVVRRFEQLFTGKISGRHAPKKQPMRSGGSFALALVIADAKTTGSSTVHEPPTLGTEPTPSGGHGSNSSPNEDHTEIGGNGNSPVSGTKLSPPMPPPPEERPTRLLDLGPHRDADGWVYLNLMYNLAQLHMINVTPDFVRSTVSEISTKFQLSPDGRKIRWRGGPEGTKFSNDSSGYNSPKSPSTDGIDGSEKKRKRQKTSRSTGNEFRSGSSSNNAYKFGTKLCAPSESFHYQPLLVRQDTSDGQTPEPVSCFRPAEDRNPGESGWGLNCAGESTHKKQRHEGAIIYYSGASFCIDLSGDPGDISPTAHPLSTGQNQKGSQQSSDFTRSPRRTSSESFINYRPLSDRDRALHQQSSAMYEDNNGPPGLTNDDSEQMSDIELDLVWADDPQYVEYQPLEPCGLGGVFPEDHFMVLVATKRPKQDILSLTSESQIERSNESTEEIIHRLATMSTSCPVLGGLKTKPCEEPPPVEVEYLSGRIKRLAPAPLPSPAIFIPPFSSDNSMSDE